MPTYMFVWMVEWYIRALKCASWYCGRRYPDFHLSGTCSIINRYYFYLNNLFNDPLLLSSASFTLRFRLLAGCSPVNWLRCVVFIVTSYICAFRPTHPYSRKWALAYALFACNHQHVANSFKPIHVAKETYDSSSMSFLTNCAVVEFATNACQLLFSRLYDMLKWALGQIFSPDL